jgi:hypothetical protein
MSACHAVSQPSAKDSGTVAVWRRECCLPVTLKNPGEFMHARLVVGEVLDRVVTDEPIEDFTPER